MNSILGSRYNNLRGAGMTFFMNRIFIFCILVIPTLALLYFSLTRSPRDLPSALLGKMAPDFILQSMEGETIALSALKGDPVILNFWSTWCGSCVGEHRLIREALRMTAGTDTRIYSVLYEDTVENATMFEQKYGKGAPILLDPGLKTAIDYGVAGVPETFFIDKQGVVVYKQVGMLNPQVLTEQLAFIVQTEERDGL